MNKTEKNCTIVAFFLNRIHRLLSCRSVRCGLPAEARSSSWSDFEPFGCFIVPADRPYTFVILGSAQPWLGRLILSLVSWYEQRVM